MVEFSRCPSLCRPTLQNSCIDPDYDEEEPQHTTVLEDGDRILMVDANPAIQIRAKGTMSTELAARAAQRIPTRTFEELVPEYLRDYRDVFKKKDFDELPPHCPWDHAIELLLNTESVLNCKIYPLSSDEQEQLDAFLEEHLRTGRIRTSKSPMASPFFFVKKKDGKLRPVQDY
jgi:hypothetical protein